MTQSFTKEELQPNTTIIRECCTTHTPQEYKVKCENGIWYVYGDWYGGNKEWYEIALYGICKLRHSSGELCEGVDFRIMPNHKEDHLYVVNDRSITICLTANRDTARKEFVRRLRTFNNPFGNTGRAECKIHTIKQQ